MIIFLFEPEFKPKQIVYVRDTKVGKISGFSRHVDKIKKVIGDAPLVQLDLDKDQPLDSH